ncbi:MAG: (2Fe-2S)-binding protein [Desulfobacterota bacterium]|nr:(2Fe-2S)-binding protein [Thermodesulfobacteriota bacterium]
MKQTVHFVLNGDSVGIEVEPHRTLLEVLRDDLGLTGTKEGCGMGECGACTVLVNGKAVNSCLFPILEAEGTRIMTIEGLAEVDGKLHPLQKAFIENGAVQCGFCTPGMILSAKALLDEIPHPTEEEIRLAISGNLCRCTGYIQIIQAIQAASQKG